MRRPHPLPRAARVLPFLALCLVAGPAAGLTPYHALDPNPKVLALTPGLEGADFADLLDRLETGGFVAPVAMVGAGIVLIETPGLSAALEQERAVSHVLRREAGFLARAAVDRREAGLLSWWNRGFETPEVTEGMQALARGDAELCHGSTSLEDALAERGGVLRSCGPQGLGRVHFAAGRVVVSLVLPESQGPGTYRDWTGPDMIKVTSELARALNWWSLKSGNRARFVLVDHGRANTQTEPANLLINDEHEYIEDCMQSLGFTGSCAYDMLHQLNESMMAEQRGNFAFTQFILNAENFPGSGALAYAYLGGPHTVALLGNGVATVEELDRVIAHEMGHIFQAADEYASGCGGCGGQFGYLNVPNFNCVSCPRQEGKCVMRGSGEYTPVEMAEMERWIHPCHYTKGAAGLWDVNGNTILDVMETFPETELFTVLADTLDGSRNTLVRGRAWDVPFPAPQRFGEPITINSIRNVEFRVSGGWNPARPTDGFWSETEEEFEIRLPELGGGWHQLAVRAKNSVSFTDDSPATLTFFVYDVLLRRELAAQREGASLFLTWAVDGHDFGSTYRVYRKRLGAEVEEMIHERVSEGIPNGAFEFWDRTVTPGNEYVYRLEVDIPDKGVKNLGIARESAVLPEPSAGSTVRMAPNPTRGDLLFTVTVPRGPRPDRPDILNPEDGFGGSGPAAGPRDEEDLPGGTGGPSSDLWRDVKVTVFDVRGRLIRDLGLQRHREASRFNMTWDGLRGDGTRANAGVYFLRVDFGYASETSKVVLVR